MEIEWGRGGERCDVTSYHPLRDLINVKVGINGPCARQGAKNTLKNLFSETNNKKRKERKEKKSQGFMIRGKATPNTLAQV